MFLVRFFFILLFISFTLGCSVLTDYPDETGDALDAFQGGNFDYALRRYDEEAEGSLIRILALMEGGTVAHTAGRYSDSKRRFEEAESLMEELDQRAKISASETGENLGSVTVNDKTMPYEGLGFERVMMSTYQAFNYLLEGGLEDAMVEIRRGHSYQDQAYDRYAKEIEKDKSQSVDQEYQGFVTEFRSKFETTCSQAAGSYGRYELSDRNVFQIASTLYLSSVLSEMDGENDNATIDLKKLHQMNPGFIYGKIDWLKLSKKLGDQEEADMLASQGATLPPPDAGSLVVFFQCDMAPIKQEASFVIPTGGTGFQKIAWPVYYPSPNYVSHVDLSLGGQTASSQVLSDMNAIAIRYFIEHSRARIIRTAIRIAAKIIGQKATEAAVTHSSGEAWGALAGLTASALASYTEQADLRSWLTLPRSIQACRIYVPAGEHRASLQVKSSGGGTIQNIDLGTVKLRPNQTKIVVARSLKNQTLFDSYPKLNQ